VSRPTAIQFPKFTEPVREMACGQAHILAVTQANSMYSWGNGSYGALGFGNREDVFTPRHLKVQQ